MPDFQIFIRESGEVLLANTQRENSQNISLEMRLTKSCTRSDWCTWFQIWQYENSKAGVSAPNILQSKKALH
jgi:hypothetical protein